MLRETLFFRLTGCGTLPMFRRNFDGAAGAIESTRPGFCADPDHMSRTCPAFRSTRFEGILSSMDERAVGEGLVAQMVEHGTFNSGVMGSSPIQPTNATDGY